MRRGMPRPVAVRRRTARRGLLAALSLLAVCILAGASGTLQHFPAAAAPDPGSGVFECRWTESPIRIDGRAGDAAWKAAAPIDGFSLPWLGKDARPARAATRARLLWDREHFYFLAEMEDRDLFADVTERDGRLWDNDVFELFLKPSDEHPGYYEFQVNAAGAVLDMFLPRRGAGGFERYRAEGDFNVEARVALQGTLNRREDRDRRWTVEGRIPWRDFLRTGGRPEPGEQWKMALCRYDYTAGSEPELSTCAPLTARDFHRFEQYAGLRFVGPAGSSPARGALPGRVPLLTSRVAGSPDPPPPYRARRLFPALRLPFPVAVVHEPGSDRLIAILHDSPGGRSRLVRFRSDPGVDTLETLLTLDRTAYDVTFHPGFARNGHLYLASRGPHSAPGPDRRMRVSRYTLARRPPYALDPGSEHPIIEWPSDGHDGGAMVFGRDGMFYVTTGDGTSDSDTHVVGQDLSKLTAKVLRIDVDRPDPGRAYGIPADNPFLGLPEARPETWAYGFRNPWRMAVDRETGHIWVGNNGQDLWETAYLITRGANYGWSVFEGSHPFYPNRKLGPTPVSPPTVEHPHSEARSLTGGVVYYGRRYPELRGAYIYGDYSTGKIWGVRHDGARVTWHRELADTSLQITGFGADPEGELLIADNRGGADGALYTLDPAPIETAPSPFPRRLSESGLFRSVKGHLPEPALIPYSVNSPLWSDGAHKERYLALPGADSRIDFTTARGWNFPDGTVLVKSFALEAVQGRPSTRRWIETRFLTRQDGEWAGYSYRWNEAQTDAELVGARGEDGELSVRVPRSALHPDGQRRQVWRYPSRAECMVCHSRAANFVLGLSLLQMNREHDYGRVRADQLRTLERLGVLRVDWASQAREAVRADAGARGLEGAEADAYAARQGQAPGQRQPRPSSLLALPPERYPRLADPYDPRQDLDARARSYLHANCAQCHVEAGGGNAQIELEYTTARERMRLFDVLPQHHLFGLPDARLVAPGAPARSVLLHRVASREKGFMPPLATSVVDREAVKLLEEWIRRMGR